ncbi:MAG: hypothetical protein U0838_03430 [Chloroflexota bacterium]
MVFDVVPASMAWLSRVRFVAFAAVGIVAGHELLFLIRYGASAPAMLARTGHAYWPAFAVLALALASGPIIGGLLRLARLRAEIRRLLPGGIRAARPSGGDDPSYLAELRRLAPRLLAAMVGGLLIQENIEALASGGAAPGLWAFGSAELPVVAAALVVLATLLAAAAAWFRWRAAVLRRRLAAARTYARLRHRGAHPALPAWRVVAARIAHGWIIARRLAGRAPPLPQAA